MKESQRYDDIEPGLSAERRWVGEVGGEPALRRCPLGGQTQERQARVDSQVVEGELGLFEKLEKPAVAASQVQEKRPSLQRLRTRAAQEVQEGSPTGPWAVASGAELERLLRVEP